MKNSLILSIGATWGVAEEKGVGLKGWLSGPKRKEAKSQVGTVSPSDKRRIAILPLSNISPDPQDEYFADGMTEEVISTVSKIAGLEVISRTSMMQYKKTPKPVREVSRELDAGTVLEGSVRKAGNKLRVTIQMIDAEKDRHIWSESYDRDLQDIFAIQSDIAKKVAEALQIQILSANKEKIERSPTSSVDAYTLYLQGRLQFDKHNKEAGDLAIRFYEEAVARDPNFALAYAGLAEAYSSLAFYGILSSNEAAPKARMYAKKALQLDDSLAKAHQIMGGILRNFDWDPQMAEREFKRATELNPSLADAYRSQATLMMFRRRMTEAVAEARRALELDPLSEGTAGSAGTVFLYAGHNDEAIQQFTRALVIDPDNGLARSNLGLAYVRDGRFDLGLHEMEAVHSKNRTSTGQADLAYAYAKAGRLDELAKQLKRLLEQVDKDHELAYPVAAAHANLGDRDRALEWLERAYEWHVTPLISANADFVFDPIRSEPRFQALMHKLGYDDKPGKMNHSAIA